MDSEKIENTDVQARDASEPVAEVENNDAVVDAAQPRRKPRWAAWVVALALLCAIIAWMALLFSDTVSVGFAVASLGLSIAGVCGLKRSFMRDVSITCLIASAILLLVYAIFFFGIRYAISMI